MRIHGYVGGIFAKLLGLIMMIAGSFIILYSNYMSEQTGASMEGYSIVSWIVFIIGLILFLWGIIAQRRAIKRLRGKTPNPTLDGYDTPR